MNDEQIPENAQRVELAQFYAWFDAKEALLTMLVINDMGIYLQFDDGRECWIDPRRGPGEVGYELVIDG